MTNKEFNIKLQQTQAAYISRLPLEIKDYEIVIAIIILLVYTLVMIKIGGFIPPSLSA